MTDRHRHEQIRLWRPLIPEPARTDSPHWIVPLEGDYGASLDGSHMRVRVAKLAKKLCVTDGGAEFWAWYDPKTKRIY